MFYWSYDSKNQYLIVWMKSGARSLGMAPSHPMTKKMICLTKEYRLDQDTIGLGNFPYSIGAVNFSLKMDKFIFLK